MHQLGYARHHLPAQLCHTNIVVFFNDHAAFRDGRVEDAYNHYSTALAIAPHDPSVLCNRSFACYKLGGYIVQHATPMLYAKISSL